MNEQTVFTLNQAAKATGRSKGTLSKALASGRLSYLSKSEGGYRISAAELFRVFPVKPDETGSEVQLETHQETPRNRALQREIELLRERLSDKDSVIEDLRRRLDDEAEERRHLSALITDQRKPARRWAFWSSRNKS